MYVEICIMNHKGPFHTNTTPQTLFNSSTTHYRTQKTCEGYSASPTALSRPRAGPTYNPVGRLSSCTVKTQGQSRPLTNKDHPAQSLKSATPLITGKHRHVVILSRADSRSSHTIRLA